MPSGERIGRLADRFVTVEDALCAGLEIGHLPAPYRPYQSPDCAHAEASFIIYRQRAGAWRSRGASLLGVALDETGF
jgi:hypothetical protein